MNRSTFNLSLNKGLSIMDVRSQGWGVQCGHFVEKGEVVLQVRTTALFWCKNTSDFSKFMVCPHGTEQNILFCCLGNK